MAISRYDQRKNYEAEEANAIGTEYLRANLLSGADADRVHQLLQEYVRQRMLFYETRREPQLHQIDTDTTRLETELWSVVRDAAEKQPTPPMALVVSGMNDALNARAYTQAGRRNRGIPRKYPPPHRTIRYYFCSGLDCTGSESLADARVMISIRSGHSLLNNNGASATVAG